MAILGDFLHELGDNTAEQLTVTAGTFNPATGKNESAVESWVSVGNCLFWKGAQAESVVASKIRDIVDAVACFEPTVSITGVKLRINGTDVYEIIGKPDDIAGAGEVIQVALKEIT